MEKALTQKSMPPAQNRKRRPCYRARVSSMLSVDLRKFLSGLNDKWVRKYFGNYFFGGN